MKRFISICVLMVVLIGGRASAQSSSQLKYGYYLGHSTGDRDISPVVVQFKVRPISGIEDFKWGHYEWFAQGHPPVELRSDTAFRWYRSNTSHLEFIHYSLTIEGKWRAGHPNEVEGTYIQDNAAYHFYRKIHWSAHWIHS